MIVVMAAYRQNISCHPPHILRHVLRTANRHRDPVSRRDIFGIKSETHTQICTDFSVSISNMFVLASLCLTTAASAYTV